MCSARCSRYGAATISRLPTNIGLFCKRAIAKELLYLQKDELQERERGSFALTHTDFALTHTYDALAVEKAVARAHRMEAMHYFELYDDR